MEEQQKTEAIKNCQTFAELFEAIEKHSPFISNSRSIPIEYKAEKIINKINSILDGDRKSSLHNITRANGIRNKVIELLSKEIKT